MGVHRPPKDEGSWKRGPRHERMSLLCDSGSVCDSSDEQHKLFQCSAVQVLRNEYALLLSEVCVASQELPVREGNFSQPSLTDGPSEYSLYEVELIERWAQVSL